MRLTTKARYAVMAMADISQNILSSGYPVALTTIAERQNLPLAYLEQLFLKLRKANLVKSSRGAAGGYNLVRTPQEIRILDIITAVDSSLKTTRCENDSAMGCQPGGGRCVTHDLWDELDAVVKLFLARVTLADVCNQRVMGMGRFWMMPQDAELLNVSRSQ